MIDVFAIAGAVAMAAGCEWLAKRWPRREPEYRERASLVSLIPPHRRPLPRYAVRRPPASRETWDAVPFPGAAWVFVLIAASLPIACMIGFVLAIAEFLNWHR